MVVLGLVFWVGWHVWQIRQENAEIEKQANADRQGEETKKAIDRY
jgi:predicted negative regulator of RcsB-dependent stress response